MELKNWGHPCAISFGEIIIYGNQVHSFSRKCVKINRKRRNQCFSFPCMHLSNFTLMKCNTTNQLDVIMNHVPNDRFSSCIPRVGPNRFISFEVDIVVVLRNSSIKLRGSNLNLCIIDKSSGSFFYHSKGFRKNFFQSTCNNFLSFKTKAVYFLI